MQNVLVVWVEEGPAPRWGAGVWGREFRGCRYAAIPVYKPAPLRGEEGCQDSRRGEEVVSGEC